MIFFWSINMYSQFTGNYTLKTGEIEPENLLIVLDTKGSFHMLKKGQCLKGIWELVEKNKIVLKFSNDPIDLFVFDWDGTDRVYFQNFGFQNFYFNMGLKSKNQNIFRPILKQRDGCAYKEYLSIKIPRKEMDEVTIAIDEPKKDYALYTYSIPEKYEGICIVANKGKDIKSENWTIEFKDKKYTLNNIEELKKSNNKNDSAIKVLAVQMQRFKKAEIEKFREENSWLGDVPIQKVEAKMSYKTIDASGKSILTDECDENYDPGPFHYEPSKQK